MSDFRPFAAKIHERFNQLSKHELFVITEDGEAVWDRYIAAFPAGTNPVYKTRTEHECSCCRQFVKNLGNVVAIIDGKPHSIWGATGLEHPYDKVAEALNAWVVTAPIKGVFRSSEGGYGAEQTNQLLEDKSVKRWNHFHGTVAPRHFTRDVAQVRGDMNTTAQVFDRGLAELKPEAIQDVLALIDDKGLYRGEEHLKSVQEFAKMQLQYLACKTDAERDRFVWSNIGSHAARFRNTVIGTLIQDLSSGVDLEVAVKSFESKVAPANYKRPTALITPRMVESAMKTINELDLQDSLQRRFAKISDVNVNDVMWVDNSVKSQMKGGIADTLMAVAKAPQPDWTKAEDITIDEFVKSILPKARSIDMFVKNHHEGNLVSLTAPEREESASLFKWPSKFAWSYNGNVTDSIRERVKSAGGDVDAKLRFSLAWSNTDDLDIHVFSPRGDHIYFGNKMLHLDVDMNSGWGPLTKNPVENVSFKTPADGIYRVEVHQFAKRESADVGLTIEVANGLSVQQFNYKTAIPDNRTILVGNFTVKNGVIIDTLMAKGFVGGGVPRQMWGIQTESAVKVQTIMLSPNYWGGNEVGNKHFVFMLEGCKNDKPTRGIYNEFLHSRFEEHRKVFEVLGDKTKCPVVDEQLSGLGFSSTKRESVTVQVKGDKLNKLYNINF